MARGDLPAVLLLFVGPLGVCTNYMVQRRVSSLLWYLFSSPLFIRVPYYIGDLKGDPSLENYPHIVALSMFASLQQKCSRLKVCGPGARSLIRDAYPV